MTKNVEARLSLLKGCEHRKKRIYAPLELEKYESQKAGGIGIGCGIEILQIVAGG